MRPRVLIAKIVIRIGSFIQSLAVSIMKPSDLTDFSEMSYSKNSSINEWTGEALVKRGMTPVEKELFKKIPLRKGRLLLLGVGGGREAIFLAKNGFDISGVDFISEMVEKAGENMEKEGFDFQGIVQDLSDLDLEAGHYDVSWLSSLMYSSVPTKRKRMDMSRRIFDSLKPGGYFACQFHWSEKKRSFSLTETIRKIVAFFTLGNFRLEKGDKLWYNLEFTHVFSSKEELAAEFEESGFEIIDFNISGQSNGEILLHKPGRINIHKS